MIVLLVVPEPSGPGSSTVTGGMFMLGVGTKDAPVACPEVILMLEYGTLPMVTSGTVIVSSDVLSGPTCTEVVYGGIVMVVLEARGLGGRTMIQGSVH